MAIFISDFNSFDRLLTVDFNSLRKL